MEKERNKKMHRKKKPVKKNTQNDNIVKMATGKDLLMKKFENISALGIDNKKPVEKSVTQSTIQKIEELKDVTSISSSLNGKKKSSREKGGKFEKESESKNADSIPMKKKTSKRKIDEDHSTVKSEECETSNTGEGSDGFVKKKKKSKTESAAVYTSDDVNRNKASDNECDEVTIEEEEEDEEKKEIRRKKREQRKLKKIAKEKLRQENAERAGSACGAAIEYLKQWDTNRSEWKFMKVRQVWLLQNMFDSSLVEDDMFDILLRYLEALKGHSRATTVASAEKIMEADTSDKDSEVSKLDRARQIIQLLS